MPVAASIRPSSARYAANAPRTRIPDLAVGPVLSSLKRADLRTVGVSTAEHCIAQFQRGRSPGGVRYDARSGDGRSAMQRVSQSF